ncbi:MAG: hypothetical protein AAFR05_16790 [Bacteroidota bacterium]
MSIRALGSYWPQDAEGRLLNPCQGEHLSPAALALLAEVLGVYRDFGGRALRGVYLRGSVARGTAVAGVSDFDSFAVLEAHPAGPFRWQSLPVGEQQHQAWRQRYPDFSEVELAVTSVLPTGEWHHPHVIPILQFQSLRYWGQDFASTLPAHRPGPALARNYRWLAAAWDRLVRPPYPEPAEIRSIAKTILRAGFEFVMMREARFTLDLFPCYRSFAGHYPRWAPEMRRVLEFFLHPPHSGEAWESLALGLGQWMVEEARDLFPTPPEC